MYATPVAAFAKSHRFVGFTAREKSPENCVNGMVQAQVSTEGACSARKPDSPYRDTNPAVGLPSDRKDLRQFAFEVAVVQAVVHETGALDHSVLALSSFSQICLFRSVRTCTKIAGRCK